MSRSMLENKLPYKSNHDILTARQKCVLKAFLSDQLKF